MGRKVSGKLLQEFRRKDRKEEPTTLISRREKVVLWLVSLHFFLATWLLAGNLQSTQWLLLAVALLGFLALFVPMQDQGRFAVASTRVRENCHRLLRFPLFWLGLLWIVYLAVQSWNDAWYFMREGPAWWMLRQPFHPWLPRGVDAPFDVANSWSIILRHAPAWLAVCTVWVGLRHRVAVRLLLWIVVINLSLWAAVAIGQYLLKPTLMLGFYNTGFLGFYLPQPDGTVKVTCKYFGTMINPNHGGAMLSLGLLTAGCLGLLYFERTQKLARKSGPHLLFFILGMLMLGGVGLSLSRAAIVYGVLLGLLAGLFFVLQWFRLRDYLGGGLLPGMILTVGSLVMVGVVLLGLKRVDVEKEWQDTQKLFDDPSSEIRFEIYQAGWQMASDNWLWGWGGGAFRYFFPGYLAQLEGIDKSFSTNHLNLETGQVEQKVHPLFFNSLHNDWLEAWIEMGVLGLLPLLAGICWYAQHLWRRRMLLSVPVVCLVLGLAIWSTHGLVDFTFAIPALTLTFGLLAIAALAFLETEHERILRQIVEEKES